MGWGWWLTPSFGRAYVDFWSRDSGYCEHRRSQIARRRWSAAAFKQHQRKLQPEYDLLMYQHFRGSQTAVVVLTIAFTNHHHHPTHQKKSLKKKPNEKPPSTHRLLTTVIGHDKMCLTTDVSSGADDIAGGYIGRCWRHLLLFLLLLT